MNLDVVETKLRGVYVLEPQVFGDARGWFMESWSRRKMEAAGLVVDFVQDNQSSVSADDCGIEAAHARLRQADDLLSAVDADARRDTGYPRHHDTCG